MNEPGPDSTRMTIFFPLRDDLPGRYRPRINCQEHPLNEAIDPEWERGFFRSEAVFKQKSNFVTDMKRAKEILAANVRRTYERANGLPQAGGLQAGKEVGISFHGIFKSL